VLTILMLLSGPRMMRSGLNALSPPVRQHVRIVAGDAARAVTGHVAGDGPGGVATVVFFVLYQQFENHVLQVTIMSRTVDLNPLVVLVSVLVGVELFGLVGALLAIPAAGVIQVVARDLWDERRGRPKPEPTIGADEVPVSEVAG